MTDTPSTFQSLAAISQKQHQDQSKIILTGASYAFRSSDNQKMIDQALGVVSTLCQQADTEVTDSIADQVSQQCDALAVVLGNIQTADRKAIAMRATLDQPQLKLDATNLNKADAELVSNLKSLSEKITSAEPKPKPIPPTKDEIYSAALLKAYNII